MYSRLHTSLLFDRLSCPLCCWVDRYPREYAFVCCSILGAVVSYLLTFAHPPAHAVELGRIERGEPSWDSLRRKR